MINSDIRKAICRIIYLGIILPSVIDILSAEDISSSNDSKPLLLLQLIVTVFLFLPITHLEPVSFLLLILSLLTHSLRSLYYYQFFSLTPGTLSSFLFNNQSIAVIFSWVSHFK